jgi:hypothetical protein
MPAAPPFGSDIFPRPGKVGPERGRFFHRKFYAGKSSPFGRAGASAPERVFVVFQLCRAVPLENGSGPERRGTTRHGIYCFLLVEFATIFLQREVDLSTGAHEVKFHASMKDSQKRRNHHEQKV